MGANVLVGAIGVLLDMSPKKSRFQKSQVGPSEEEQKKIFHSGRLSLQINAGCS